MMVFFVFMIKLFYANQAGLKVSEVCEFVSDLFSFPTAFYAKGALRNFKAMSYFFFTLRWNMLHLYICVLSAVKTRLPCGNPIEFSRQGDKRNSLPLAASGGGQTAVKGVLLWWPGGECSRKEGSESCKHSTPRMH